MSLDEKNELDHTTEIEYVRFSCLVYARSSNRQRITAWSVGVGVEERAMNSMNRTPAFREQYHCFIQDLEWKFQAQIRGMHQHAPGTLLSASPA